MHIPRFIYHFTLLFIVTSACNGQAINSTQVDSQFKNNLHQRKIDSTDYRISLPVNYIIKESRGPDFTVYYFHSADTADRKSFSGGFYLGNWPSRSAFVNSDCKEEQINSYLLGENKEWTLYRCGNIYKVQIITDSKSGQDWSQFIQAFGMAATRSDLDKLLEIFSTLTTK